MNNSQPHVSLIELLEVVFRIYRKWEDEHESRVLRCAAKLLLDDDKLDLSQEDIDLLKSVANGRKELALINRATDLAVRAVGTGKGCDPSAWVVAEDETSISYSGRPIELCLWEHLVAGVIRRQWTIDVPGEEFDDGAFEDEIREYCADLVERDQLRERIDGSGTYDAEQMGFLGGINPPDGVSRELARLDRSGLGDEAFTEIISRYPKIVPRIEEMLSLSDLGAVSGAGSAAENPNIQVVEQQINISQVINENNLFVQAAPAPADGNPPRTKRAKRTTKVAKRNRAKQVEFTPRENQFLDSWIRGWSIDEIKDDLRVGRSRVYQIRKSAANRNPEIFAQAEKKRESVIEERRSALPKANPCPSQKSAQIRSMKKADKERAARRKHV